MNRFIRNSISSHIGRQHCSRPTWRRNCMRQSLANVSFPLVEPGVQRAVPVCDSTMRARVGRVRANDFSNGISEIFSGIRTGVRSARKRARNPDHSASISYAFRPMCRTAQVWPICRQLVVLREQTRENRRAIKTWNLKENSSRKF